MGRLAFRQEVAMKKRSKKEFIKPIGLYVGVFALLVSVVANGYQAAPSSEQPVSANVVAVEAAPEKDTPKASAVAVDEKTATDIATNLALQTNMPVAANVASLSISLEAEREIVQEDSGAIAKPQIVQSEGISRDIIQYVSQDGENAQTIADKFGITKDTVLWANNLDADEIDGGTDLKILPVTGVLHSVEGDDTVESLASKYKVEQARIVSYNDLEVDGITAGQQLIIPGGVLPEEERPGYVSPAERATQQRNTLPQGNGAQTGATSNVTASVGNRYAFGNCTFYAYERRPDIGSFWGNASSWAASARAAGFTVVQGVPQAGAIFQYGGGYGHVGIVESVDHANGTMRISDMNGIAGCNRVGYDTVPINGSWNYIY